MNVTVLFRGPAVHLGEAVQRRGMTAREQYERLRHPAARSRESSGFEIAALPEPASNTAHRLCWRREFPGEEASVPAARNWARALLAGRVTPSLLHDALLLLSEVVTNAVAHSGSGRKANGHVTVWIAHADTAVQVEVTNVGSADSVPTVHMPDLDDESGRGLWLVEMLATAWGAHRDGPRNVVWFRVDEIGQRSGGSESGE